MLKKNLRVKIVPQNIDAVFETVICNIDDEYYYFKLDNNAISLNETFDGYVFSDNGIIFFSSIADKIEDDTVAFSINTDCQLLQRRQYDRIKIDNDVVIQENNSDKCVEAWLVDISVGGFKMHLKNSVDDQKKYKLFLKLGSKDMVLDFKVVSLVKEMENLYTLSARFESISSMDKITLVQYCYKKQAEKIDE